MYVSSASYRNLYITQISFAVHGYEPSELFLFQFLKKTLRSAMFQRQASLNINSGLIL